MDKTEDPTPPRVSSLDRKIAAAKYRMLLERAVQPGFARQGLTDPVTAPRYDPLRPPAPAQPLGLSDRPKDDPIETAQGQAAQIKETVPLALQTLSAAMKADPGFALSWHANIAMAFKDAWSWDVNDGLMTSSDGFVWTKHVMLSTTALVDKVANAAATCFMRRAFGVSVERPAVVGIDSGAGDDITAIAVQSHPSDAMLAMVKDVRKMTDDVCGIPAGAMSKSELARAIIDQRDLTADMRQMLRGAQWSAEEIALTQRGEPSHQRNAVSGNVVRGSRSAIGLRCGCYACQRLRSQIADSSGPPFYG